MIEINTPQAEAIDVDLVPERALLGRQDPRPVRRLGIGRPVIVPLTQKQARDAIPMLNWNGNVQYTLLQLDVTFYPSADEPHVRAAVGVSLVPRQPGMPVAARSLSPQRSATPVHRTTTLSLSLNLRFAEPAVKHTTDTQEDEPFIIAYGEGQPDPEWRLTRTRQWEIDGIQTLRLIAEAPASAETEAQIAVSTTINRKKFGLITYRADLPREIRNITLNQRSHPWSRT